MSGRPSSRCSLFVNFLLLDFTLGYRTIIAIRNFWKKVSLRDATVSSQYHSNINSTYACYETLGRKPRRLSIDFHTRVIAMTGDGMTRGGLEGVRARSESSKMLCRETCERRLFFQRGGRIFCFSPSLRKK